MTKARTRSNTPLQDIAEQFLNGAKPDLRTLRLGEDEITVVTKVGDEISLARAILDAKLALQVGDLPTAMDSEAGVGLLLGAAMEREGLVRGPLDTAVSALVRGMVE